MPMIPQTALPCWLAREGDSVVLEVLHHMNWPSELMIANQSNHYRIIRRVDRLIAYKPLVDEAIELLRTDQKSNRFQ
jgi:hypothetical protein